MNYDNSALTTQKHKTPKEINAVLLSKNRDCFLKSTIKIRLLIEK